jgi:phosphohistidine phosphatase
MLQRSERTLILLRHAKSDWSGDDADIDRPLATRGLRQAPDAGRWLADQINSIDLAVVSPANRARTTWALVAAELKSAPPVRIDERAYAASADELLDIASELPDDVHTVVLVGHNPGIEVLASLLTGEPVSMRASSLAVIATDGPWSSLGHGTAVLEASGRPKGSALE